MQLSEDRAAPYFSLLCSPAAAAAVENMQSIILVGHPSGVAVDRLPGVAGISP